MNDQRTDDEDLAAAEDEVLNTLADYAAALAIGLRATERDAKRGDEIERAVSESAMVTVSVLIHRNPAMPVSIAAAAHAPDGTRTPLGLRRVLRPQATGRVQ